MADIGDAYAEIEKRKASEREDEPLIPQDKDNLLGQILTANVKWSQDISNRVEENLQRDAKYWRDAFKALFDDISEVNEVVDSRKIDRLLDREWSKRTQADQSFYWEKENY